jgi:hypothetical protein
MQDSYDPKKDKRVKEARVLFSKAERFIVIQRFLILTLLFMPILLVLSVSLKEWLFAWAVIALVTVGVHHTRRTYLNRGRDLLQESVRQ